MKYVRAVFGIFLFLLISACLSPHLLPSAYLAIAGVQTEGEVMTKREEIRMSHDDRFWHTFKVQYRYRVPGSLALETVTHAVSPALFDALQAGKRVRVIYGRLPLVGSL